MAIATIEQIQRIRWMRDQTHVLKVIVKGKEESLANSTLK